VPKVLKGMLGLGEKVRREKKVRESIREKYVWK
jgi:hypothetical protein